MQIDARSFLDENHEVYEIEHYLTPAGKDVYLEWQRGLRDVKARVAVDRRVDRMVQGNFGDHKYCRDGVWEMRIDVGAGYRVYYAISGTKVILLLCGGDKKTQSSDIERACRYWDEAQRSDHNAIQKSR